MTGRAVFATTVVAALVAGAVSSVFSDEKVELSYKYKEGDTAKHKVSFSQEVDFGGFSQEVIMDFEVTEACRAVDGDMMQMAMTFDKAEGSISMMGNMQDHPLAPKLVGQSVTYQLGRMGDVDEIKPDGYFEAWAQAEQMVDGIITAWYVTFPEKKIGKDDSWSDASTDTVSGGMIVNSKKQYKCDGFEDMNGQHCAVISLKSDANFSGKAQTPMGSMQAEGTGKEKGQMYVVVASGLVIKVKYSMENNIEMTDDSGNVNEVAVGMEVEREAL